MVFPVVMYGCESWTVKKPKTWCFWTVVLEKTLESPLDCKEIKSVHSEGGQSWVFFGRNDAKAETPVLWLPHAESWLIGKYSDARRDWGPEEKGTTEDEMAGWHHQLDGRESEWTLGVGDGQGGLACCDSRGHKQLDTTEQLNWTEWSVMASIFSSAIAPHFMFPCINGGIYFHLAMSVYFSPPCFLCFMLDFSLRNKGEEYVCSSSTFQYPQYGFLMFCNLFVWSLTGRICRAYSRN